MKQPREDRQDRNPVEELAESFIDRYRKGEQPEISEYAEKHPELADEIRELFPALLMVERLGTRDNEAFSVKKADERPGSETHNRKPLSRLGEFVILRELGRGGMGVVYEAEQESLGRRVALKVLPFHRLMDERRLARFQREARAAAGLQCPGIVPVFGIGEAEGLHYYIMQFIPGQGLDEVLVELRQLRRADGSPRPAPASGSQRPLAGRSTINLFREHVLESAEPPGEAADQRGDAESSPSSSDNLLAGVSVSSGRADLRYFHNVAALGVRVAEALEYAHRQGVLHRDIKPSNLLLEPSGQVWVTDFGLAKAEGSDEVTASGEVVGTLGYMAPERLRGWSDPRSDIYSLGATLYELLTLQPAFEDSDRGRLVKKITEEDAKAPRLHEPRVPRDLETVILKSLEKEPAQRYRSMGELAEDLHRFLEDRPILAERPSTLERALKWSRRNKPVVAALAILGLLVVTLAVSTGLVWRASRQTIAAKNEAEGLLLTAQSSLQLPRNPGRALLLAIEGSHRVQGIVPNNALESALAALHEHRTLFASNEFRSATFSPDGKRVLTISDRVHAWDVETGELLFDLRYASGDVSFAMSPDGRRVLTVPFGGGTARLFDAETTAEVVTLEGHVADVLSVLFSPLGRWVLISSSEGTAQIWKVDTGEKRCTLRAGEQEVFQALGPAGNRVVISMSEQATSHIRHVDSGEELAVLNGHADPVLCASFSRDGGRVITGSVDQTARIWDAESGIEQVSLVGHERAVVSVSFGHSAMRVLTASQDDTARIWDAETGAELVRLEGHEDDVSGASFSFDGQRVVTASLDQTARIWNTRTLPGFLTLQHDTDVLSASFGRDGRRVVTTFGYGIRHWDAETGELIISEDLDSHMANSRTVCVSPDGKRLVVRSEDGSPLIWDLHGTKEPTVLEGYESYLENGAFDVHGGRVLTVSRDGTVGVWDAETGRELAALKHEGEVSSASFSFDGRQVVTACYDNTARIWDLETSRELRVLKGHEGGVLSACFSPDGRRVATGSVDNSARIWDSDTAEELALLKGHEDAVTFASFSFDGKRVVTASVDKTAYLWDVETGDSLVTLRGHTDRVNTAVFSPDGRQIVTASNDGTVRIWPARDYLALALAHRPRELTPDERDLYEIGTLEDRVRYREEWNLRLRRRDREATRKRFRTRAEAEDP